MSALVGALRAVLSLESAAFTSGLKNASAGMADFDKRMKHIGGGMAKVGAALSVVGAGIAAVIKGELDYADQMGKSASKFGVPVEELSKLNHAAELSDVSMETLGGSLGKLSKNMVAAMKGGKASKMFDDLGIAVKDATGAMRPTDAVLADLADRLKAMPDVAQKTALAMQFLGKSGAEMIPMLNDGGAALRQAGIEAQAMGLVIDGKTSTAAQNFNDNLSRLKGTLIGLETQMMAAMAPALERISALAVDVAKWFQNLSPATQEWMAVIATGAIVAGPALVGLGAAISAIGVAVGGISAIVAASPVILFATALGGIAYVIYQNWQDLVEGWKIQWAQMSAAATWALNGIKSVWDGISAWFAEKWVAIKNEFAFGWLGVTAGVAGAYQAVVARWDQVTTYFAGLWVNIKQTFVDGWAQVKATTAQWYNDFLAIGGYIVDGLKAGIQAKWADMVAWLTGMADDLVASVKGVFDTHSPSRVFREIGQFLTEGLGLGIADNAPMVQGAMDGVNAAVVGGAGSLTSAAGDFASAWKDAFKGFVMGTTSAKDALAGLASKMADSAMNGLFDGLFGGSGKGSGLIGSLFGFANGGAFQGGNMMAFANGGVVSGATPFAMKGGLGVMGEAGPEAIMPLTRGPGGKLGVAAMGGGGGGTIVLELRTDSSVIAEIAQNTSQMVVREGLKSVPDIVANHNKRRG